VWTYGELRRANQVAHVLTEDLGLVPGNRVLLRSPNNPWTVAAWLGVLKAGGIVVTTMAALRARELAPIVEKTRPAVALVDHRFTEDVEAVRDTVLPDLTIVAYGGDAPDDLTRQVAAKPASSPPSTPPPTTSPSSDPPRAAPAYRRSPRTSTATSCRSTTPSAGTRCACGPTISCRAPPRSRSPSASASWSSAPCAPVRARC
jgi:acyl-CoA synthetase (AMP-forming)/AMP-acid ligase II